VSAWRAFAVTTFAIAVLLLGSNIPTPLFPLYAQRFGLSPLGITLVFATYTLVVIPTLVVLGTLSDAKGRRTVLLCAIVVAAVAAALFAAARSAAWLFAAEAVQAIGLGALQGAAAPTLLELHPETDARHSATVATAATLGGAALGPLVGGGVAALAPSPLRLPYLIELALLVAAFAAVLTRVPPHSARRSWRPRRLGVPRSIRSRFAVAALTTFVGWAVVGLFLSLIPSFVADVAGHRSPAWSGLVAALMLGGSAVAPFTMRATESVRVQLRGVVLMLGGLVVLAGAAAGRSTALLVAAALLAGPGQGLTFAGSLGDVTEAAPEDRRGEVVASYYVAVYLGTSLPVIALGAAANAVGLVHAIEAFAACAAVLCALAAARLRVSRR
jgi:MFS family permease